MDKTSFVFTKDKNCQGCNKCIYKCPVGANEAFFEANMGKVFIKSGFCISCGECLSICDHNARDYVDDLEFFYEAIENNEDISVVIAPAVKFNFTETKRLISYLKNIGVKNVYDVSLGADICTWAHVKAIREQDLSGVIAQPCPVVVSYIEKYHPSLIKNLSPIHSPVICLAIYLKKYLGLKEKIMFLSPCIGKKRECTSEHTGGVLEYNVTFNKFNEYLEKNNIDLKEYDESEFDNIQGSIGFTFSRPGGLSENIKYHLDEDVWIKQIEGISNIEKYFEEYIKDINENKPVPLIVDALNCEHGCNLGTGTHKTARQNEIDFATNKAKMNVSDEKSADLMSFFDGKLNYNDFIRTYSDKSNDYRKIVDEVMMERAFISLGKITKEDREINCFCCGYGNCHDFVYDLATGHNDRNNCRHYLLNKFKKLSQFDDLTGVKNRYSFNLTIKEIKEDYPGFVGIAYIDINGLKQANDMYGHSYGDELIIGCSEVLKAVFPSSSYRVGGDEFVVLDYPSDISCFDKKIERLKFLFKMQENLVVSIGSSCSLSSDDLMDKLEEADKEMYRVKEEYYNSIGGRDRRSRK